MIKEPFISERDTKLINLETDLCVIGGGLAGVCAAIMAARSGLQVVLVQDRPVLGGNSSSEVRLWCLGATSHMGNNNRWSREGGLVNEILLENLKRNKEGNPLIFDTILLEKVYEEKSITLLLNTSVYKVGKKNNTTLSSVTGFCSQNSTTYQISAPLFCDASGDGIVAFSAGASFRMGAEKASEFDEGFAPNVEDFGNLLGHSLYFYTKDTGRPVSYTAPSFAIKNAGDLPRIKNYRLNDYGCRLWWVEYGGRLDTVHQSEKIKLELWKVVYGIWDYVKNSGEFPESENLTLEWVGTIPGKRESRRFEGDYMLSQKDIVEQRDHYDAVAFGGWAMDLHPADGVYSQHNSCTQWHSKGVYTIPYRCYYSKDIDNLFLAGRIISASHVAFGSSRVMLTCAHGAQAVGMAAALCKKKGWMPRELGREANIKLLQLELNRRGQGIPRLDLEDTKDLLGTATIKASSTLRFTGFEAGNTWQSLEFGTAQLLPLQADTAYTFEFEVNAVRKTQLEIRLMTSSSGKHYTPDHLVENIMIDIQKGVQKINYKNSKRLPRTGYAYICLMKNELIRVRCSDERITGILNVRNKPNKAVSNYGKQEPSEGIGIHEFEFWIPERRPNGKNFSFTVDPSLEIFEVSQLSNGRTRPDASGRTNAWAAAFQDERPEITLEWHRPVQIKTIRLFFDCDYDHALESTLMGHPEDTIPFIVEDYTIRDDKGTILAETKENYQAINVINLLKANPTKTLVFQFKNKNNHVPVAVFNISVYGSTG